MSVETLTPERQRTQSIPEAKGIIDAKGAYAEFAKHRDYNWLIDQFDRGETPVRDVGEMTTMQRKSIAEWGRQGSVGVMAERMPNIVLKPVNSLRTRLEADLKSSGSASPMGDRFFADALDNAISGYGWAGALNTIVKQRLGVDLEELSSSTFSASDRNKALKALTDTVGKNRESAAVMSWYLAERSLAGEAYQNREYGEALALATDLIAQQTVELGVRTGLSSSMQERAMKQLKRVHFSGLDVLVRPITSQESRCYGSYQQGTLRAQVSSVGSFSGARPQNGKEALRTLAHEAAHGSSAQSVDKKGGLRLPRQSGYDTGDLDEGMAEMLKQRALGYPDVQPTASGVSVGPNAIYKHQTAVMVELYHQFEKGKNRHFAALFNAFHGQVEPGLQDAIAAFSQALQRRRVQARR